ncbi:hypothetical protein J7I98_05225 [Streptomyces sp. ISL-98]|uniref:hypothetical protein n=1 Tax=Streptomyces sp. ISL-98 TaxID=2819192 RepID=UPI001BE7456A|nr:hypothetical protein [Streptomyces sp. ISL-98]MBT2505308.1 hypothetical protein [Streptomyces sp. ISL-98]
MGLTLEEFRKLSDAELVTRHDQQAENLTESTSLYLNELNRRAAERSEHATRVLSVINAALAVAAVAVAVIALLIDS